MNSSAEENVPSRLPTVEIAYRRPETVPASATSATARRSAYGATAPETRIGIATSTVTPSSEPTNAPAEIESSASTATPRNGSATNGTAASSSPASSTIRYSPSRVGLRSASRPPYQ